MYNAITKIDDSYFQEQITGISIISNKLGKSKSDDIFLNKLCIWFIAWRQGDTTFHMFVLKMYVYWGRRNFI
jgi:hypothetical protein